MCGIYKITNLINQKSYIGQSKTIEVRWRHHKAAAKDPSNKGYEYPLYRAIRKYGIENFIFEIIEECSLEELDIKEQYYINKYNSIQNGYNQVLVQQAKTTLTNDLVEQITQELLNSSLSTEKIGEKFGVSGRTIRSINNGESWFRDDIAYPIRKKNQKNYCISCNKQILKGSIYCENCAHIAQRKVERPTKEELKSMIRTMSFVDIGKKYGVTDNTIRKWCKIEKLPFRKKDIILISDNDWKLI